MSPSSSILTDRDRFDRTLPPGQLAALPSAVALGALARELRVAQDLEDEVGAPTGEIESALTCAVLDPSERAVLAGAGSDVAVADSLIAARVARSLEQVGCGEVSVVVQRTRPVPLRHSQLATRLRRRASAPEADGEVERARVAAAAPRLCILDVATAEPVAGRTAVLLDDLYEDLLPRLAPSEAAPVAEPQLGDVFDDKYLILHRIGVGGFGTVYEARDLSLGALVAIKVLHPGAPSSTARQRELEAEARRITRVKHPNIVDWKALGTTPEGSPYFVMERLEGESLEGLLARELVVSPDRACKILAQILRAWMAAHKAAADEPILHLDLKPANVFVEPHPSHDGEDLVKVFDFGVGHLVGEEVGDVDPGDADDEPAALADETLRRTVLVVPNRSNDDTGEPSGVTRISCCTPNYAAPEQGAHMLMDHVAEPLDARCDVYSTGIIAYRMLTGCLPFDGGEHFEEVLRAKLELDPVPVGEVHRGLSNRLANWVDKAIRRDPAERWATAAEAYEALEQAMAPRSWRIAVWIAASCALCLALVIGLGANPSPPTLELLRVAPDALHEPGAILTERRVDFGPDRPVVVLEVAGATLAADAAVRCLGPAGERPIPDLLASGRTANRFEVTAPAAAERRSWVAVFELTLATGEVRYTDPIELVQLPLAEGAILAVDVAGRLGRAIDPQGQVVQIDVALAPDDLAHVRVRPASGDWSPVEGGVATDSGTRFELPLSRLQSVGGLLRLDVEALDRAGGRATKTVELPVQPVPLEILHADLAGAELGDVAVVGPSRRARLTATFSGRADASWQVLATDGREIAAAQARGVTELDVPLDELAGEQDLAGRVVLTLEDAAYVYRLEPPVRGSTSCELRFLYTPAGVDVAMEIERAAGAMERIDARGRTVIGGGPRRLRLTRNNSVPVRAAIAVDGQPLGVANLATAYGESWEGVVDLSEGLHRIEVQLWHASEAEASEPDRTDVVHLQVDSSPPVLRLADADAALVLRAGAKNLRLGVALEDRGAGVLTAVRWELLDGAGATVALGALDGDLRSGTVCELGVDVAATQRDGSYVLWVRGQDPAGNSAAPLRCDVELARAGPVLQWTAPDGAGEWRAEADGKFLVEVRAQDPNGLAAVRCEVATDGELRMNFDLHRDDAASGATEVWRARVAPRPWWGREDLELRVHALDAQGNETTARLTQQPGTIVRVVPPRVEVTVDGEVVAVLEHVAGNATSGYVFGGRGDEVENRLFAGAGLPPFNPLTVRRSWMIPIDRGTLGDYYLARTEVTVGQFGRMLAAEGDAATDSIDPERRAQLRRSVAGLDPSLAMSGLRWDEAQAFAEWLQLRLPTFVELEYAVRGANAYRPCAYREAGASGPLSRINVGTRSGGAPWAVDRGADATPDGRFRGLSSNVAEWTQTPADRPLPASGADALARATDERLAAARMFWVVGPSFASSSPGFDAADARSRTQGPVDTGMRCAADLEWVVQHLDRDLPHGVRLRIPEHTAADLEKQR